MPQEKHYVDAMRLVAAIQTIQPPQISTYAGGSIDSQIISMINMANISVFDQFKHSLVNAIYNASQPYDKCMLCVQRDGDCLPPDPR